MPQNNRYRGRRFQTLREGRRTAKEFKILKFQRHAIDYLPVKYKEEVNTIKAGYLTVINFRARGPIPIMTVQYGKKPTDTAAVEFKAIMIEGEVINTPSLIISRLQLRYPDKKCLDCLKVEEI